MEERLAANTTVTRQTANYEECLKNILLLPIYVICNYECIKIQLDPVSILEVAAAMIVLR